MEKLRDCNIYMNSYANLDTVLNKSAIIELEDFFLKSISLIGKIDFLLKTLVKSCAHTCINCLKGIIKQSCI